MPELDNDSDRLEQFFRKATNKPDLAFSEDDWRKLEARLDAADSAKVESPRRTIITAVVVGALLLSLVGIWWGSEIDESTMNGNQTKVSSPMTAEPQADAPRRNNDVSDGESAVTQRNTSIPEEQASLSAQDAASSPEETTAPSVDETQSSLDVDVFADDNGAGKQRGRLGEAVDNETVPAGDGNPLDQNNRLAEDRQQPRNAWELANNKDAQRTIKSNEQTEGVTLVPLTDSKIRSELVVSSSELTERNKQKAPIELPGAEEADQTGRQTMVEEEHASEKEHVAKPRLSLLLSFAPDFSGTSFSQYSPPGKAFAGMIHYHLKNRWSISAGVVKNYKQYTGTGEDYSPPAGYWKYYTNGIIPETIDGSCNVLEFPIMVQYTVREGGKNRWIVGAGASSYVMQTESYRYHFAQPNPGAKEGWDSRGSARFMFNMLNLTVGYEHQVIPGLMIGLEPYVKLPLEEIGWSNLKLYSSGASLTLRYTVLGRKQIIPGAFRSRGPD